MMILYLIFEKINKIQFQSIKSITPNHESLFTNH